MEFIKYQHVERFGTDETDGIDFGEVYIFPKLDGTNGSVWMDDGGVMQFGSRQKHLVAHDNAGFKESCSTMESLQNLLFDMPHLRLFGEWLVPHTLKTYTDEAWKKFYVFDVHDGDEYMDYDEYSGLLDYYGVDFIAPLATLRDPTLAQLEHILSINTFLIKEGEGVGEGIVLKNYDYKNKYGRQTWAKIVNSGFKNEFRKNCSGEPGTPGDKDLVEDKAVAAFLSKEMVDKTYANIVCENDGWSSKYIQRLLGTVWHDFVVEQSWSIVNKYKNPKIDYRKLQHYVFVEVKKMKSELF